MNIGQNEVLSEERQSMKWVGIFRVGIFRANFAGGSVMGGNFRGGSFPGGYFLLEPFFSNNLFFGFFF